ncbi:hypothetical protein F5B22DRAFT_224717 [Xylaria bambusicola]|uniref:uncharacterized protein n=1 Tax=Xylaria bambusicola TaxID=326684 RepID=UPI0020073D25|nr:uncharacterized protein F5B22DRAFT_224717 [Xylaria bambusicola]KAI0514609.1 hypothetical protein F5B22DRAFT_224717 [Xylaria bambusicola]
MRTTTPDRRDPRAQKKACIVSSFKFKAIFNLSVYIKNIGDTSYERRQMPQEDLETILLQLQNDLIETVRMVRPSRDRLGHRSLDDESTEGGIELAIKTCINSCLSKWSPPSKRNSSSQAETSTSQITGTFDSTLLSDGTGSVASSATKHFNNHTSEGQNKSSTLAQIPEPQPPAGPILPPHIINEIRRLIRQELAKCLQRLS